MYLPRPNQLCLILSLAALLLTLVFSSHLLAQPMMDKVQPAVSPGLEKTIISRLKQARPQLSFTDLEPSPIEGLYRIKINGQLAFVSEDGGHLIAGEMFEVQQNNLVNLQEEERRIAEEAFAPERAKILAKVSKDDMIIYSPEKEAKGFVYVFTDIDCGFCRRLHSQMEEFLAKGIEIRYLAFPRAGIHSQSAKKLATTWCAKNPQDTMTQFKSGQSLPLAACEKAPIAEQYMIGQDVGVRGTPAIILESGQMIPGAVSPDYLAQSMGIPAS
jgi:thiol:disulfide interchange protein DsbC